MEKFDIFEFKGDRYTFDELFRFHKSGKNLYREGEVLDTRDETSFDISDIYDVKEVYWEDMMRTSRLLNDNNSSRLIWANKNDERDKIIEYLNNKYNSGTISIDELDELIKLEKDGNRDSFSIKYKNYIFLNIDKKVPKGVSNLNVGRFHRMLHFLSYDNKLKSSPRKNGRVVNQEDLMEEMDISNYKTYRRFISNLCKFNIIKELSKTNGNKIVLINPVYTNRNIRVDYTTYLMFKDDILPFLTDKEVTYLEMLGTEDELTASFEIEKSH